MNSIIMARDDIEYMKYQHESVQENMAIVVSFIKNLNSKMTDSSSTKHSSHSSSSTESALNNQVIMNPENEGVITEQNESKEDESIATTPNESDR